MLTESDVLLLVQLLLRAKGKAVAISDLAAAALHNSGTEDAEKIKDLYQRLVRARGREWGGRF